MNKYVCAVIVTAAVGAVNASAVSQKTQSVAGLEAISANMESALRDGNIQKASDLGSGLFEGSKAGKATVRTAMLGPGDPDPRPNPNPEPQPKPLGPQPEPNPRPEPCCIDTALVAPAKVGLRLANTDEDNTARTEHPLSELAKNSGEFSNTGKAIVEAIKENTPIGTAEKIIDAVVKDLEKLADPPKKNP